MALKNNRDLLPCPFFRFVRHFISIKLRLTVRKTWNRVKIGIFSPMTKKLDRWYWKTIGHLAYASSTFMHHFLVISEFNFELQSRNHVIGKILAIFCSCDLEITQMTFKNSRASPLCSFKPYASFHSHQCILISVTVRKRPNRVKFDDFVAPLWPWNFKNDLEKQYSTSSKPIQALCIIS